MKIKKIIIISFLIISLFLVFANTQNVYAENRADRVRITQGGSTDISKSIWGDALALADVGNIIVGIIRWVGIAILIGAIIVKGIRFVSVSPEGKAEIKKEIIMLAIGAVILLALTRILGIIISMVQKSGLQ